MIVFLLLIMVTVSVQGLVRGEIARQRSNRDSDRVSMLWSAIECVQRSTPETSVTDGLEIILPLQMTADSMSPATDFTPVNFPSARVRVTVEPSGRSADRLEWVSRLEHLLPGSEMYQTTDAVRRPLTPATSS